MLESSFSVRQSCCQRILLWRQRRAEGPATAECGAERVFYSPPSCLSSEGCTCYGCGGGQEELAAAEGGAGEDDEGELSLDLSLTKKKKKKKAKVRDAQGRAEVARGLGLRME
jgi:hypothetical protein